MSAVSLLETSFVLAGGSRDAAGWAPLDRFIAEANIAIVLHDAGLTRRAREAFLTFGRGRHTAALNLGDCISYALAQSRGVPLLYKGDDFSRTDVVSAM